VTRDVPEYAAGHHQQRGQDRELRATDPVPCAVTVVPGERYGYRYPERQPDDGDPGDEQRPLERLAKHLNTMQQRVSERYIGECPLDHLVAPNAGPEGVRRLARGVQLPVLRRSYFCIVRCFSRLLRTLCRTALGVAGVYWSFRIGRHSTSLDGTCVPEVGVTLRAKSLC
jgi:hypothetical protein